MSRPRIAALLRLAAGRCGRQPLGVGAAAVAAGERPGRRGKVALNFLFVPERPGSIQCRERLGGLLKYYAREAA